MRLTLRTMLAYLDDVLSEADAHELGQKIESSDFASGLVHRIRNSISRLRLASPDMLGNDSMDDPNTVAEFIDSALSPEQEQEFEKVCLQSDKHLSEVASCHQILTMVLGTPARVETRLRDRIYRTGVSGDERMPVSVGFDGEPEAFRRVDDEVSGPIHGDAAVEIKRPRPLSDSTPSLAEFGGRRNLWWIAAAVLLGFLLTGGFMIAMGPLDGGHPLAGLLGLDGDAVASNDSDPRAELTAPEGTPAAETPTTPFAVPSSQSPPTTDSPASQENQPSPFASEAPSTVTPKVSANPAADSPWVMPESLASGDSAPDEVNVPFAEVPEDTAIDSEPGVDERPVDPLLTDSADTSFEASTTASEDDAPGIRDPFARDSLADQPSNVPPLETAPHDPPTPDQGLGIPGLDDTPLTGEPVKPDDIQPDETVAVAESTERVEPTVEDREQQLVEVGRFFSEGQVLLYWDEQAVAWLRLPPRTALSVGHQLKALQIYHPQLLLAPGNIQVTLRGNSEIRFAEPIDAETPTLDVPFGRFLLNSTGRENARMALRAGQRLVEVEFTEPTTEVICQVRSILLPGLDPREEPPHRIVQLWVTRGSAKFVELDEEQQVDMGQVYAFADDVAAHVMRFDEVPSWLHHRVGQVDRDAAAELETLLPMGRDVVLSLTEAAGNRRTDVRSLAIRCLVTLEQYRNGVSLFSVADRKHQFTWPALFDELREAISHGPESAAAVHDTFESLYGREGESLYEMLLGYNEEQLQDGAAEQLVSDLDHPRVEFRIMAIQNLQRMTGKTLLYGPVQSEKHRSSKITRWRNELKKGKVTVSKPPEDVVQWQQLSRPSLP